MWSCIVLHTSSGALARTPGQESEWPQGQGVVRDTVPVGCSCRHAAAHIGVLKLHPSFAGPRASKLIQLHASEVGYLKEGVWVSSNH